jgi:hypothetical protein
MSVNRLPRRLIGTVAATLIVALATPALTSPAAADVDELTGIEYRHYTTPSDHQERKSATVDCTGDKVVVGTGFTISSYAGNVLVEDVIPSRNSVTVWANEDEDGNPNPWSLTAGAVCADAPLGWQIVSNPSFSGEAPTHLATASCPTDKLAIGAGLARRGE